MGRDGRHAPRRPRIEVRHSSASPEEAAAIVAGIEQFLRDTAPAPGQPPAPRAWARSAVLEGAGRDPGRPDPWGDPEPWGR